LDEILIQLHHQGLVFSLFFFILHLLQYKHWEYIPVLQKEIFPPMLIRDRKFHMRTYVVVLERFSGRLDSESELDPENLNLVVMLYNRHEVRIAPFALDMTNQACSVQRDRSRHITNGAFSDKTERVLLNQVEELKECRMQQKLEFFVADIFARRFISDMRRRVIADLRTLASSSGPPPRTLPIQKFAIAGLDVMADANGNLFMLEVNVNPAAPPKEAVNEGGFSEHLVGFMTDLIHLQLSTCGYPGEQPELTDPYTICASKHNFLLAGKILERM